MIDIRRVRTAPRRDFTPRDVARSNAYSDVILTEGEAVEAIQYIEKITDRGMVRHAMSMQVLSRVVPV